MSDLTLNTIGNLILFCSTVIIGFVAGVGLMLDSQLKKIINLLEREK